MEIENRTKWHPAFCNIIELELMENAEGLTYDSEHNLKQGAIEDRPAGNQEKAE